MKTSITQYPDPTAFIKTGATFKSLGEHIDADSLVSIINDKAYNKRQKLVEVGATDGYGVEFIEYYASSYAQTACKLSSTKVAVFSAFAGHYVTGYTIFTLKGKLITASKVKSISNYLQQPFATPIDTNRVLLVGKDFTLAGNCVAFDFDGDETLTEGPWLEYTANNPQYPQVCKLDTNKAMIIYEDLSDSQYGKNVALSVDANLNITKGNIETFFNTGAVSYCTCAPLGVDKALCTFNDDVGNKNVTFVATTSGLVVTNNAQVDVDTAADAFFQYSEQIEVDKAILFYRGVTNYAYARVITVTGTVPAIGARADVSTTDTAFPSSISEIETNKFIVSWYQGGLPHAKVLTVSGSTITPGTVKQIDVTDSTSTFSTNVVAFSSTEVLYACYYINTDNARAYKLNIDGTTINHYNTPFVFDSNCLLLRSKKISDGKFMSIYRDVNNSNYLTGIIVTLTGEVFSAGAPQVLDTKNPNDVDFGVHEDGKGLIHFDISATSYNIGFTVTGTTINVGLVSAFTGGQNGRPSIEPITSNPNAFLMLHSRDAGATDFGDLHIVTVDDNLSVRRDKREIATGSTINNGRIIILSDEVAIAVSGDSNECYYVRYTGAQLEVLGRDILTNPIPSPATATVARLDNNHFMFGGNSIEIARVHDFSGIVWLEEIFSKTGWGQQQFPIRLSAEINSSYNLIPIDENAFLQCGGASSLTALAITPQYIDSSRLSTRAKRLIKVVTGVSTTDVDAFRINSDYIVMTYRDGANDLRCVKAALSITEETEVGFSGAVGAEQVPVYSL